MNTYLILGTRPGAVVQILAVVEFDSQQTIEVQLQAWRGANPGYDSVILMAVIVAGQSDAAA